MPRKIAAFAFLVALFACAPSVQAASQKLWKTCGAGSDLDAAIKACTQMLSGKETNKTKSQILYNRAWAYRNKGEYDLAIADDTRAIELDPKNANAFQDRATAYFQKKDYDLCIADSTRAMELDPKMWQTYNNRGVAYREKGDFDRALADLNRAVELNPSGQGNALFNRGTVYNAKGDYERAIADFSRSISLDQKDAGARKYRAVAYLKTGKFDQARADLISALQIKPDYEDAKATLTELEQAEATAKGTPIQQAAAGPSNNVSASAPTAPLVSTPSTIPLSKRVALVVGNSQYENIGRLDNPVNDAKLIAAALKESGFELVGDGPQIDLDKGELERAVQDFGNRAQGADVALFYYAGHGVQVRGANYLVPVNANPTKETDVDFQMLDANLVLRQMEGAGTRLNLVMLDACRNNPFAGRGLRATNGGLAQMQAPEGTLISFATEPGTVAQDGSDGNSPYTKALAEIIRTPGLGIFDSFNQVGLKVKQTTGGAQRPWLSSSPIEGAFYFKPAP
jgi:tetratricopeptide (TPR) repeat protein